MKNDILGVKIYTDPSYIHIFRGVRTPQPPMNYALQFPIQCFLCRSGILHLAFCILCEIFFFLVLLSFSCPRRTRKKNISHRQLGPLRGSSSPFSPLSRRGLNPSKPVYDPDQPDGRLNLTASAFNQLGQYTSSPSRRGYSYEELAVFFPSGGRNHRQSHCAYPRKDGQAELAWVAG